jgi:hypothetical protein
MERDRRTFRPVRIPVAGKYKTINTVMGAGKLPMNQWPEEAGPARKRAEMTVLEAFNDAKSPAEVRQAFLYAADETYLDYREDDQAP